MEKKVIFYKGEYYVNFENLLLDAYDEYLNYGIFRITEPYNTSPYDHPLLVDRNYWLKLYKVFPTYGVQAPQKVDDDFFNACGEFMNTAQGTGGIFTYGDKIKFDFQVDEKAYSFKFTVLLSKRYPFLTIPQVACLLYLTSELSNVWYPELVEIIHC